MMTFMTSFCLLKFDVRANHEKNVRWDNHANNRNHLKLQRIIADAKTSVTRIAFCHRTMRNFFRMIGDQYFPRRDAPLNVLLPILCTYQQF